MQLLFLKLYKKNILTRIISYIEKTRFLENSKIKNIAGFKTVTVNRFANCHVRTGGASALRVTSLRVTSS